MEYSKAISYVNVFPDTQRGIQLFVEKVLNEVEIREALPLLIKLTAMGKIIEGIKLGLKDQLLEEASLSPEKSFTINGVRITKTQRTQYYYHNCPKWVELDKKIKELEAMMKVAKSPFADVETGEIINPALQSGSESLTITLNKE